MADLLRTCRRPHKGEFMFTDTYRLMNNQIQTQDLWDLLASWQTVISHQSLLIRWKLLGVLLDFLQ